jgi:thiol:disulfide interchange protein
LFGVFELGASMTALAGSSSSSSKSGLAGSFFSGILATAVATPCTGPFLGTAIGFAVTLPAFYSLMIFTSLALGMSLPYLLLAAFPQFLRFLPKPGNWMVTFKEVMGFLMLATAIWLVWVFGAQTNNLGVALLLAGFFFLGLACWIFGKWGTPVKTGMVRRLAYFWTAALFCFAGFTIFSSTAPWVEVYGGSSTSATSGTWEPFSEERIAELQKKGIPVFVDFTAKWCLICQANHYILTTDSVSDKFEKLGVVKMKADWTKNDPAITKALRKFGRSGVPLYLLYGSNPEEAPAILPQVLTADIVIDYLDNISTNIASQ